MGRDERGRCRRHRSHPGLRVGGAKVSGAWIIVGSCEGIVAQTSVCESNRKRLAGDMGELGTFYHRNLPHWHPPGRSIFLTWRLYGSLSQDLTNRLRITRQELIKRKPGISWGWTINERLVQYKRLFAKIDAILDKAEAGPLWLKQHHVAALVQHSL